MENYKLSLPEGALITKTEICIFEENTDVERTCLLIYYFDKNVPSDVSPFRMSTIVLNSKDAYKGAIFTSQKDIRVTTQDYVPFDMIEYAETLSAYSMFSFEDVIIIGEQKAVFKDGKIVEQYLYKVPSFTKNDNPFAGLKCNLKLL